MLGAGTMLGWSRAIVPWSSTQCQDTPPRPPTTPTHIYITYIYTGLQDGSDVREPVRAREIGASADRERRQSRGRR